MRVLYCAAASESCRRWAKLLGILICKAVILEYLRVGEGYLQAGTRRSSCVEAGIEFGCRDRDQRGTVCAAALWPGKGGGIVIFTVCECWNGCAVFVCFNHTVFTLLRV